ncbi:ankyrin repeat-containing domain protein [Mycena pura]|uniref:Ankyrin repeat-containing domain protein n=1 Tax=Mycena pura TaxID=153505 RepID=A0AAD6Y4B1_9AGAR|nr:ankyrin repeat-containing domain protein [Mycena pura]
MAEVVGFVSSIAGLVALAGQITKISYGYLSDIRDAKRTRGQYLTELSAFTDALLHAEKAAVNAEKLGPLAPRPASLSTKVLDDCREQLDLLRQNLKGPAADSSGLARLKSSLVWPLEEKQTRKHIDMLHSFRGIFADYVSAITLALTEASYSHLGISSRERDRSQLLEWLQPPNPPLHGSPTELACPGTGKWFLESDVYVRWRTSAPSLLWCRGKPGVGKSILSSIVLQDICKNISASVVVHYFCDFAAGKQQTATLILQSLVRQMLVHGNDGHISVLKRCRERLSTPPSLKDLFQALIEMCKLQRAGPYIVLDALDELEDRKVLLPLLGELVQVGCHIFATSRYIPDIADALTASEQVELEANRADVKLFVESELQASDFAHVSGTSSIIDVIVEQAGGIFLLARLLTNHLLALTTIKEIRRSLATLPSNLTSAYQSSLDRILAQPPARAALALRVIAWITHAERRLTTAELLHALAVEDDTDEIDEENFVSARIVLQVCVGLVLVNDDTSVSLVHATAHKFFQDMPAQFANTHIDMASTCLHYLCMRTFGAGPCKNVLEMDTRLLNMPFLAYAAHHWGRHARRVEQPLIPLIRKLLDNDSLRASSFQALQYRKRLEPQLAEASFAALPAGQPPLHVVAYWDLGAIAELYIDGDNLSLGDEEGWTPLHWACFKGSATVRKLLLDRGAVIDMRDSHDWTPLFWASFNGDIEALTNLLDHGADHLVKDIYSWTALQWAVSCGERSTSELLLNHHARFLAHAATRPPLLVASLTVKEARNLTHHRAACSTVPAEIAAETGDADLLDTLLQGMDPGGGRSLGLNEAWEQGRFDPPMTNVWRAMSKYEAILNYRFETRLLDGVLISENNGRDLRDWRSRLLHTAIRDDKIIMVRLLLELGTEANYTVHGRTALHTAAFRKDARFAGADTTLLDDYGYTALHRAIMNGFEETTATLVTGGADVNARTDHGVITDPRMTRTDDHRVNGTTPLQLACGFRVKKDEDSAVPARIATLLLAAGADTTAVNDSGNAVIHYAVEASDVSLVKLLLENGAKIPVLPDPSGHGFIHTAVEACDLTMVKLLLENGAKIPPSDPAGYCVIRTAVKNGDLSMVKLLLENGANIPAPDPTGYCVVHAFAESYSRRESMSVDDLGSLLDLLLEQLPADAESMEYHQTETVWGDMFQTLQCPLSLAMKSSNWDVFETLLKHGAHLRTTQPLEPFLKQAIQQFNLERVHFLLDHGAKLGADGGDIVDLMRPYYAINLAHQLDTFILISSNLVQHGGNINSFTLIGGRETYFGPPLLVAAENVDVPLDIVRALLAAGADLYRTNNEGLDAFMLSALHENVTTLCLLLETTTKVPYSAPGGHWTQPLCSTSLDPSYDSIAYICECLKQHNLLAHRTKCSKKSLLQLAVEAGSAHTVACLIACGADVDAADIYGWTALHKAILSSDAPVVDLLLTAGADVHAVTQRWPDNLREPRPTGLRQGGLWTGQPLHLAAMTGDVRIVTELLMRGADVHASTGSDPLEYPGHGPTALHIALDTGYFHDRNGDALDRGRLEITEMLVERGAEVRGVVDQIDLDDVLRFEGFEELWNKLRAGVTDNGKKL